MLDLLQQLGRLQDQALEVALIDAGPADQLRPRGTCGPTMQAGRPPLSGRGQRFPWLAGAAAVSLLGLPIISIEPPLGDWCEDDAELWGGNTVLLLETLQIPNELG
jgi:hypothetical protein